MGVQNTQGRLRFWTEIAVYLGNGKKQARSCHGTLTGSHMADRFVSVPMTLSVP